jgi:mannose-6-phosphate isomerase-like protein (cupin superfamily)
MPDAELARSLSDSNPDIERMRELAAMIAAQAPGFTIYEGGSCGRWLFTEPADPADDLKPGGSGQLAYMAPGQRFDVHAHHGATEILVVVNGVLAVAVEGQGETRRLSPGDSLRLLPGERHNACAVTAPTELSRDPLSEFVAHTVEVVQRHDRELGELQERVGGVLTAEAECRDRQTRAWEKLGTELEGIRSTIGKLATGQAEHAKTHEVERAGVTRQDHTLETVLKYLTPLLVVALGAWLKLSQ